jgi:hypothetical protein
MIPAIGRIVHYTLSDHDVQSISQRRLEARGRMGVELGNPVHEGDVFPAMITRVWDDPASERSVVQLQVFLDGSDQVWVSSVEQGTGPRKWFEPPRVPYSSSTIHAINLPEKPFTDGPLHNAPTEIAPGVAL